MTSKAEGEVSLNSCYFFVRIQDLRKVSPLINTSSADNLRATFVLGTNTQDTLVPIDKLALAKMEEGEQLFLFGYQAQQIITVSLEDAKSEKIECEGYANILLTPLIKIPYTKHLVTVDMVHRQRNKLIKPELAATMVLQIRLLTGFQGILFMEPIEASLTKSIVQFGEMVSQIDISIGQQRFRSCEVEGGIYPKWPGYYKDANTLQRARFRLASPCNVVKIELFHSYFGAMRVLLGFATVRLENSNILRFPNKQITRHKIKLFQQTEDHANGQEVGELVVKYLFIYDQVMSTKN